MAEISIIIPCHNVSQYLHRCFASLQNQTLDAAYFEFIFVDDASTDSTWETLLQLEALAPERVCAVHLDESLRAGGARNIGLSYASGNYIGFVDSDDWIEPDMYEILYHAIKETGSDLSFCRHIRDDGNGALYLSSPKDYNIETVSLLDPDKHADFIAANSIGCNVWDKLFRKDFLSENNISFPDNLMYEDIYFASLVYLCAKKICTVDVPLYHYFINNNSVVLNRNQDYHKDIFAINYLKWDSYQQRNIPEALKNAVDFDFLMTFYFTTIKILCLRYDEFLYEDFAKLKSGILSRIPDFRNNPYINTHIPTFYQPLLTLLEQPVTQKELSDVRKAFLLYHKMS